MMRAAALRKFKQFILYPDLATKFLVASQKNIIAPDCYIVYLMYTFSQRRAYSYLAIKALLMLGSVYPKNCQTSSRIIVLRYTRTRTHSTVYMPLTLFEMASSMSFSFKRPLSIESATKACIGASNFFVFPGFVRQLQFPSWKLGSSLFFNGSSYWSLFYKSCFID
jgi:hypothetical protein